MTRSCTTGGGSIGRRSAVRRRGFITISYFPIFFFDGDNSIPFRRIPFHSRPTPTQTAAPKIHSHSHSHPTTAHRTSHTTHQTTDQPIAQKYDEHDPKENDPKKKPQKKKISSAKQRSYSQKKNDAKERAKTESPQRKSQNAPFVPTPHIRACFGSWRTVSSYSLSSHTAPCPCPRSCPDAGAAAATIPGSITERPEGRRGGGGDCGYLWCSRMYASVIDLKLGWI